MSGPAKRLTDADFGRAKLRAAFGQECDVLIKEAERARASEMDLADALEKAVERCECSIMCERCTEALALCERARP